MRFLLCSAASLFAVSSLAFAQEEDPRLTQIKEGKEDQWVQLFNGKDLSNWTPKFTHHQLGENPYNTFRVEDGILTVTYEDWDKDFENEFGHLFVDGQYSQYLLRARYRISGEQHPGGEGWARLNNGLMIHGQSAESMELDQDFPASIEVQLLGAEQGETRGTGSICTPSTHIELHGELVTDHVIDAQGPTFAGDQWVLIEVLVNGSEDIWHFFNGQEVIHYGGTQYDPKDDYAKVLIEQQGGEKALSQGTISIQAESGPAQFQSIEILPLSDEDFEALQD